MRSKNGGYWGISLAANTTRSSLEPREEAADVPLKTHGLIGAGTHRGNLHAKSLIKWSNCLIIKMCNAFMPRRAANLRWRPAYWWCNKIAKLRREALYRRRKTQLNRSHENLTQVQGCYKTAKRDLRWIIKGQEKSCSEALHEDTDHDA